MRQEEVDALLVWGPMKRGISKDANERNLPTKLGRPSRWLASKPEENPRTSLRVVRP
jgi:hypothetical protein